MTACSGHVDCWNTTCLTAAAMTKPLTCCCCSLPAASAAAAVGACWLLLLRYFLFPCHLVAEHKGHVASCHLSQDIIRHSVQCAVMVVTKVLQVLFTGGANLWTVAIHHTAERSSICSSQHAYAPLLLLKCAIKLQKWMAWIRSASWHACLHGGLLLGQQGFSHLATYLPCYCCYRPGHRCLRQYQVSR